MKTRVLILGSQGMLGHQLYSSLSKNPSLQVYGTQRRVSSKSNFFDADIFVKEPKSAAFLLEYDYLINCIGIIKPHCRETDSEGCFRALRINSMFPNLLARFASGSRVRILQIATDCVFSGKQGNYSEDCFHDAEDVYGKTKSLGEVRSKNMLNLRCSIIGPELGTSLSLLGWFLAQPEGSEVVGFDHHFWNGVTTLQFSDLCEKIIQSECFDDLHSISHVHHFIPNESVTKFQLLNIFREIFNRDIKIHRSSERTGMINRTLSTKFQELEKLIPKSSIASEIRRIKKWNTQL